MKFEVRIETPYDTKVGSGPIRTAMNWRNVTPLDGAGTFSFEMSAADAQAAEIVAKRYARCYGIIDDSWTELGKTGIIDKIETVITPGRDPILRISGSDLMRELTYRTVGDLQLFDVETISATSVKHHDPSGGFGAPDDYNFDMNNSWDDNIGTQDNRTLESDQYIYIRYTTKMSGLIFNLDAGTVNNNAATMTVQYFDDGSWHDATWADGDGTAVGGATLAQDGTMDFVRPLSMETLVHDGVEGYWLRMSPSANLDAVGFIEIDVYGDAPTAAGLADVMAFAPAGWALDEVSGYAATENETYLSFAGENVLEALKVLAEHTGEHFYLGVGRKIVWIQDDPVADPTASGYRAIPMYGRTVEENTLVCLIQSLTKTEDGYEQCSRIYPHGAGSGAGRISLSEATDSYEDYTVSTSDNYVRHDATDSTLRIDKDITWPEVGRIDEDSVHSKHASNQLLAVAVEYLSRHKDAQTSYDLVVMGLDGTVNPGETIPVEYWEYVDGSAILDLDATLIILETTTEISGEGIRTMAFRVATVDAWPESEARTIVSHLRKAKRGQAGGGSVGELTIDTIVSGNVDINGGTMDGVIIGGNVPAAGDFTSLGVTGNITVAGTVDGVNIAEFNQVQFVVMTASGELANERVLTAGDGLDLTDAGAGSTATLAVDVTDFIDTDYGLTENANNIRVNLGTGLAFSTGAVILDWSGTPTTIQPDASAAGGSSSYAARIDHTHAIVAAVAGSIVPDASAAEGSASSFARSDHAHAITCAAPVAVDLAANAEGSASTFSRADHKHDLSESITPTWTGKHIFRSTTTPQVEIGYDAAAYMTISQANGGDVTLATVSDGTGHLILSPKGNVGIGTATPGELLEVYAEANNLFQVGVDAGNAILHLQRTGATKRAETRLYSAGVIKWVYGISDSDDAGDGSEFFIGQSAGGASANLWIETSGNVGIGTIVPATALSLAAAGILSWEVSAGSADTNLYRDAANMLKTDDSLTVALGLNVGTTGAGTGDIALSDDILLEDGAVVGITGNEVITFQAAGTIDFTGADITMDNDLTVTNDILLSDGSVVGITGNEIITFAAAGTIAITGADFGVGVTPSALIHGIKTAEQLRLGYDAGGYLSVTVSDGGSTKLATITDNTTGNLELEPAGHVILDPVGNYANPETTYDINLGTLQKKYLSLHVAELWVETLVAQETIATIGGRILVGPTTYLTRDIAFNDTTIYVKHNEMASGDTVLLHAHGWIEFMSIDSAYTESTNLLSNAGFETAGGGDPDFWANWTESAGDGALANEVVLVDSGIDACKATAGASANTYVKQAATVTAGKEYVMYFATRGDGTHEGRYALYDVTNSTWIYRLTPTGRRGTSYGGISHNFTAPPGCVSVELYLYCPFTDTGIAYFDTTRIRLAEYYYTVTRDLDGTGGNAWNAGDAVFNTGNTGDGFIDIYSVHGIKATSEIGPTIVGNVRNSTTYNDWTEHWAIGNLNGIYGYGSTAYGVAFGAYGESDYITIDSTNGIQFKGAAGVVRAQLTGGAWTLGNTSTEHVAISSTAVQIKNGATVYTDLTNAVLTLGDTNNEHTIIDTSGVALKDGATTYALFAATTTIGVTTTEHISISSTAVQIKNGATVYTDLTNAVLTLGDSANEHTLINTSGVALKDGATTYALFAATTTIGATATEHISITSSTMQIKDGATVHTEITGGNITVGEVGANLSNVYITTGAVQLRTNTTVNLELTTAGQIIAGDDAGGEYVTIDGTDGICLYGGAVKVGQWDTAGDLFLGSVATNKANAFWDYSAGTLSFRGGANGTAVGAYIDTTGAITAGAGVVTLDDDGITLEASTSFFSPRAYKIHNDSDVLIGSLFGVYNSGTPNESNLWLQIEELATADATLNLYAYAAATYLARINLYAISGGTSSGIVISADSDGTTEVHFTADVRLSAGDLTITAGDGNIGGGLNVGVATGAPTGHAFLQPAAGSGLIRIEGAEASDAVLQLYGDQGDDDLDKWEIRTYTTSDGLLHFRNYGGAAWTTAISLPTGGGLNVGASAASSLCTLGLTVNQGANDDVIFALQSSDVAHGALTWGDTDTFFNIKKAQGTSGGATLRGLKDADGNGLGALQLEGFLAENVDTTHDATGRGIVEIAGFQTSGDAFANTVADGNVVIIRTYRGGAAVALWILDEDGDVHIDGTQNVYDEYDDALACRDLSYTLADKGNEIMRYNRDALIRMGVLSPGNFVSTKGIRGLLMGAVGQLWERNQELECRIAMLEAV